MVSVSFLSSKFDIATTINKINESNADFIHVDFMDGKFVSYKSFTIDELDENLCNTKKPLDVHLMVNNPLEYIDYFSKFNTEYIIFHLESLDNPIDVITAIRKKNIKVGIAINPNTKINLIKPYLDIIDLVLVMSVEPGLGGQKFMAESGTKINELKQLKGNYIISVDGGINEKTAEIAKINGADILVSGSYICQEDNFNSKIDYLKCL